MSTNTTYSIKMIIRANKAPPAGYVPKQYQVDSADPEADNADGSPFNADFPRMVYGTMDKYQEDPQKVFSGPAEAIAAFSNDYEALDPLEKYYYAKWLFALLADINTKQQALEDLEAQEEEEHRQALEAAERHEARLAARAGGAKKIRADIPRQGKATTTSTPPQFTYTDIDGHAIQCDLKSQQSAMDSSNPIRRVVGSGRFSKFTEPTNKLVFSHKKLLETFRLKNRSLCKLPTAERDQDEWYSASLLHLVADHQVFKDPTALEKLLSFHFIPGEIADFSYLQFHTRGAAHFRIDNPYDHIDALRNTANILYVVAGEPWKGIFNPTIDRIQYGDLNHLLKSASTFEEHALLTDAITEAFNNAGAIIRSEDSRIPTGDDPSNKNTPTGVADDVAQVFAKIPRMDDPTAVQAAVLHFKNHGELKHLTDELAKLKINAPIKKRPKPSSPSDDDSSRDTKPNKKKPAKKTKESKAPPPQPRPLNNTHCLNNLVLQWKGDGLFKNGNVRDGETPCTDPTQCGKKHVGWKKISAEELLAALTQGPDLFGQQNWQSRRYEHRLTRDHATDGYEHACKIDGTPRTTKPETQTKPKPKNNN